MIRVALLALFFIYIGCETAPHSGQAEYDDKIDSYSAGDKQFSGLYHNFEFRAQRLFSHLQSWYMRVVIDGTRPRLSQSVVDASFSILERLRFPFFPGGGKFVRARKLNKPEKGFLFLDSHLISSFLTNGSTC